MIRISGNILVLRTPTTLITRRERHRTKRSHLAFTLLCVLGSATALGAQEISVAVFDSDSPIIFVDAHGEPSGFFPDVLEQLGNDVGVDVEFVIVDSFRSAYESVVSGEIDLLPAAVYSEERSRELDFTAVPFVAAWGQLGVRVGEDVESILDLRDLRVGIVENDQNGINFQQLMVEFDIPVEFVYFENHPDVAEALVDGTIAAGAFFNSWFVNQERIEPSSVVFSPTQAFVAATKGIHVETLDRFDQTLSQLKRQSDSYYYVALNRWFSPGSPRLLPRWFWIVVGPAIGIACIAIGFAFVLRREVKLATRQLRESRAKYRTVADHAYGWEFWTSPEGSSLYVSPNTVHVTGYEAQDFMTDADLARRIVYPDDRQAWDEHVAEVSSQTVAANIPLVFRIIRRDGSIRWIEHRGTSVVNESGSFAGYRGTNIDITERIEREASLRESIAENQALMSEIHHRVYNNLQVIFSLISIHQNALDDPKTARAFASIANRVHAFGALHESAYWSHSSGRVQMKDYLEKVVSNVRDSLGAQAHIEMSIDADEFTLDFDRALPCGLIVNEAVTNAVYHAFPGDVAGHVAVNLSAPNRETVALRVSDTGVGSVNGNAKNGSEHVGMTLIQTLTRQLHGDLEIASNDGFVVNVTFPM